MSETHQSSLRPLEIDATETLIVNLRNAHALEKQVVAVLESQLNLLDDYPNLHARLSTHIAETREQARRLDSALDACGELPSMVKDPLLSVMGMSHASVHGFADDAVLKAVAADMMTEHLEIAIYCTLIALADMAGKPELRPHLEETLHEEEAIADWFDENLETITRRFVELKATERQAKAANAAATAQRKAEGAANRGTDTPAHGTPKMTLWQQLENAKQSSAHPRSTAQVGHGHIARSSAANNLTPHHSTD